MVETVIQAQNQERTSSSAYSHRMLKSSRLPIIILIVGTLVSYVLLGSIPGFVGIDDYYHSRVATQIIDQGSLRLSFPWLPLTLLNPDQFVDHHLLYHIYLAPWMVFAGIAGVKLAQSFILGAITVVFWALLRYLQVRFASVWTVGLLAVSSPFLYRMLMIRTQAAAVLLLLITLHILFRQRYRWLIIAAFAFTWLYNGFVLLPAIVALFTLSLWITDRKIEWRPLAFALAGTALGLIINPYFPQNIAFIINHLGEKVDIVSSVRVGSEWYPYTTGALLEHSLGALLAMVLGILAGSFRKTGRDRVETTLLLIALLMLYMLFRSRRFIEYFSAFSLMYCAVACGRAGSMWRDLPGFTHRPLVVFSRRIAIAVVIVVFGFSTISNVYNDIQNSADITYMAGAAAWLEENTPPGTLVFQTDWDDFTRLFYHNLHNVYLVGLDPTYLQIANPFLWNQWVAITQGLVDRPSVLIRETFGATYVVSDTRHDDFAQRADADPDMQLVYRDSNSLIWQIMAAE